MKRFVSIVLCIFMLAAMVPVGASAADSQEVSGPLTPSGISARDSDKTSAVQASATAKRKRAFRGNMKT